MGKHKSEHAQLPWKASKASRNDGGFYILEPIGCAIVAHVLPCCGDEKRHAELIVRAVNNHAKLVAALELALDALKFEKDYRGPPVPAIRNVVRKVLEEAK